MKRWIIAAIVVFGAVGVGYYYVMNKPHRSIDDEDGMSVTADSLFAAFQRDEVVANNQYLNKVLRVSGRVKTIDHNTEGKQVIVLETSDMMFGVNCTMDREQPVHEGDALVVKGICTGYLADVVINQGVVQSNQE